MENQECWEGSLTLDDMRGCIELLECCLQKRLPSGPFRQRERKIKQNIASYDGCYSPR